MRILGIDPGLATIGFGLVESVRGTPSMLRHGVITTPAGVELSQRLLQISRDMEELLTALNPDEVAVEELYFSKNVTTGMAVSHSRGVILLEIARRAIPVFSYTPMQVKQAVVGYGKAEKAQVMEMTRQLLQLSATPRPDDAADALALAICHAHAASSRMPMPRQ